MFCFYSPRATLKRNLAVGGEIGFNFLFSPGATVLNNTCSQHMYAAASYEASAAGSVQMGNSFAFAGNANYSIWAPHPDELKTFRSDYNNIGTSVTEYNQAGGLDQKDPELWKQIQREEFKPGYEPARFRCGSKGIVSFDKYYCTMKTKGHGVCPGVFSGRKGINPLPASARLS